MAASPDRLPKWASDAIGAGLFVFAALFVVTLVLPEDARSRLTAAGTVVGAIGVLVATFATVMALRQLDLQRIGLEEQRRAFRLQQFSQLRAEYARLVGAIHDVLTENMKNSVDSEAHIELRKIAMQIELHDRSDVRARIVGQVFDLLGERHHNRSAVEMMVVHVRFLLAMVKRLQPQPPSGGYPGVAMTTRMWALLRHPRERMLELAKEMPDLEVHRLRLDAVRVAQQVLRVSIDVDEVAVNLVTLDDIDDITDAQGNVLKPAGLRHLRQDQDEDVHL